MNRMMVTRRALEVTDTVPLIPEPAPESRALEVVCAALVVLTVAMFAVGVWTIA